MPGLDAKPIIDIQVSVASLVDEDRYLPGCEAAGLTFRLRDDEHRYFRPPADAPREVHVHVCEVGTAWERQHLLFRDFLRAHPDARDAYAAAKHRAGATWRDDRMGYTEAKTCVVLDTLAAADQWAGRPGWQVSATASVHLPVGPGPAFPLADGDAAERSGRVDAARRLASICAELSPWFGAPSTARRPSWRRC